VWLKKPARLRSSRPAGRPVIAVDGLRSVPQSGFILLAHIVVQGLGRPQRVRSQDECASSLPPLERSIQKTGHNRAGPSMRFSDCGGVYIHTDAENGDFISESLQGMEGAGRRIWTSLGMEASTDLTACGANDPDLHVVFPSSISHQWLPLS
jgi:hypothetical protein